MLGFRKVHGAGNDFILVTGPATRVAASRRFAALAIQAFRASLEASPPTPT
jgi:diaminopimelate epimerase